MERTSLSRISRFESCTGHWDMVKLEKTKNVIEVANKMVYKLVKENKKLKKEIKEDNKLIKQLSENHRLQKLEVGLT